MTGPPARSTPGSSSAATAGARSSVTSSCSCCRSGCPAHWAWRCGRCLYPRLLGSCGRSVIFGQHVVLRHPHKIRIGDNVVIDDNCLIDAKGDTNAGITIAAGTFIGRNTILSCKNGDIVIGEARTSASTVRSSRPARVELGPRTLLAAYCYVIGGDHDWKDRQAGAGAGARRLRRTDRSRRLAWCRRQSARRHGDGRKRDCRRRSGGETPMCRRMRSRSACRRASSAAARRKRAHERSGRLRPRRRAGSQAERPPGVRSPGLGRVAHARRQAPVCVDDPTLRPGRFNVSLVSLRKKDLSEETLDALGVDISICTVPSSIQRR